MPARGLESRLAPEIRQWLEAELIRRGFSDYSALTEELARRLDALGEKPASRSAVYRFGAKVEERIAALKRSTEIARAVTAEVGDDEGLLGDALLRVMQDRLLSAALEFQLDPTEVDLGDLSHAIASVTRASVQQKRHQIAVRDKVAAKLAELETKAQSDARSGLDPDTLRRIREEIYGVLP